MTKRNKTQVKLMPQRYFMGLDTLRFFAAFFVVISHIHNVQLKNGLNSLPNLPILWKGHDAVVFFFTLSGFIITYLLLEEHQHTQTIDLKHFYIRRVLRIWPLYFLIVGLGLFLYWVFLPSIGVHYPMDYNLSTGVILYSLFLSNVMTAFYQVGGIMNITWSIGIEEQFYLIWAPVFKLMIKQLLPVLILITALFFILNIINHLRVLHYSESWHLFFNTLQFHFMGCGALAAYTVFFHQAKLLALPVFKAVWLQYILLGFLVLHYTTPINQWNPLLFDSLLPFLYIWLIITVSINQHSVLKTDHPWLNWLGKRSYGIYMYHMVAIYFILFLTQKTPLTSAIWLQNTGVFYITAILLTILMSHLSYTYFEKPFLALKEKFR